MPNLSTKANNTGMHYYLKNDGTVNEPFDNHALEPETHRVHVSTHM